MANLREKIEQAITSASNDPENAAIAVCVLLEDEIGLRGNGWFEDDPIMEKAFRDRHSFD